MAVTSGLQSSGTHAGCIPVASRLNQTIEGEFPELQVLSAVSTPTPEQRLSSRAHYRIRLMRLGIAGFFISCILSFAARTIHWPLVNDAAQIDYMCFLMDHGRAPYKDIMGMNMPGIYLTNWSVMHTLGGGALAWRTFDFILLAAMAAAMIVIAWPYDWLGGLYGAALFALLHGRDGPAQPGQRDLIIAVLLVGACAFLFHALRTSRNWPLFFFGICASAAATIKPLPLPFALLLLLFAIHRIWRMGRSPWLPLLSGIAGILVPLAVVLGFLLHKHALGSFVDIVHYTLPYYSHLGRQSFRVLLEMLRIPSLIWLVLLVVAAGIASHAWINWESKVLLGGIAFGILSYFTQGKGFPYHRYPFFAFLLLWAGMQLTFAMKQRGVARILGYAGLLFGAALAPQFASRAAHRVWPMDYIDTLGANLTQLGGPRLSGHIQCLATGADCDTVLYRMKLDQATGLSYDYFIFGQSDQPVIQNARNRFWQELQQNPPDVFVVSKGLYPGDVTDYRKLAQWPEFTRYLSSNYFLYADSEFHPNQSGPRGFRLYVRRGTRFRQRNNQSSARTHRTVPGSDSSSALLLNQILRDRSQSQDVEWSQNRRRASRIQCRSNPLSRCKRDSEGNR
jgi:hypothetical protein